MYRARVIKVMIASPSDVAAERQAVRDVVHDWNAIHSEDKRLVLTPVTWETHAQPAMGDRAQSIINKQILNDCDLLVAAFWTRIGSPTGPHLSGTVEEIEEHLGAGKPAMIYFSSAPVRLDSVDEAQYGALRTFRDSCRTRGLVEEYESLGEFRDKFARQLAQTIIRQFSDDSDDAPNALVDLQAQRNEAVSSLGLSAEAKELLVQGGLDKHGTIMRYRTMSGLGIQANGRQFVDGGDPRSEARWQGAFDQLVNLNLIRDIGNKGEVFNLTDLGYQVADGLRSGAA